MRKVAHAISDYRCIIPDLYGVSTGSRLISWLQPWVKVPQLKSFGIVDWIADYFERVEDCPVLSPVEPNWPKDQLPVSEPETGEDFGDVLKDVDRLILPAFTDWNHPNFHGLFPTSTSTVGVFGEMLSAAFVAIHPGGLNKC